MMGHLVPVLLKEGLEGRSLTAQLAIASLSVHDDDRRITES
jgi:hypothetical protein